MQKTKIAVVGASGRMGRKLIALILAAPKDGARAGAELVAALTHEHSASLGLDAGLLAQEGPCHVYLQADYTALQQADVVIDFALAEGIEQRLEQYQQAKIAAVICSTGLSEQNRAALRKAAEHLPVLYAANTSVGINTLLMLVEQASAAMGLHADIEILEAHHRAKKDAPSGTALLLGEAAARGRGQQLADVAEYCRNDAAQNASQKAAHNAASKLHEKGSIGFATLRAGDIVGEHTVYLVSGSERLELTHRVASRSTFAEGALRAASWLVNKPAELYSMTDVLGVDANG